MRIIPEKGPDLERNLQIPNMLFLTMKVIEQSLDGTELQYRQKNRNHNEMNT